jgi:hypothetical protein
LLIHFFEHANRNRFGFYRLHLAGMDHLCRHLPS